MFRALLKNITSKMTPKKPLDSVVYWKKIGTEVTSHGDLVPNDSAIYAANYANTHYASVPYNVYHNAVQLSPEQLTQVQQAQQKAIDKTLEGFNRYIPHPPFMFWKKPLNSEQLKKLNEVSQQARQETIAAFNPFRKT